MAGERSITFFFPYHEVSGVPVLFLTLARFMATEMGKTVKIVDYPDGYMARNLSASDGVELIPFRHGTRCVLSGNTVVVMQSVLPYRAYPELSIAPDVPVLFWHLFPINLFFVIAPWMGLRELPLHRPGLYRLLMKWFHPTVHRGIIDYFRILNERKGIVYYDRYTVGVTSSVMGVEVPDPVVVPIPIEVPAQPMKQKAPSSGRLVVAWIGRLSDFKIHILVHAIRRFSRTAAQLGIEVEYQVIGAGPESWRLDKLGVDHSRFTLRRLGVISGGQLKEHLLAKVDLVTAMGQSALESGRLGVPTILLDFAYGEIRETYRFRWLDQTIDGDLCHLIAAADLEPSDTLPAMIGALLADYQTHVHRSHGYCRTMHDLHSVGKAFHSAVVQSRMTMGHVPEAVVRRGLIRKIYDRIKYGWRHTA
jgi:hypothetical protein